MNLKLEKSEEAKTYPEAIREKAIVLAEAGAWFSLRTYLWLFLGFAMLCGFHVAVSAYLLENLRSFLFIFGLMALVAIIPKLRVRRLLMTRREEILRAIRGGFNGPDNDLPPF